MSKKKPDQVADNPSKLPYASNVGAPSIKPSNLTSFKQEKLLKTNKYFSSRYEEIKEEYKKLMETFEWNQLIYNCHFSFKPEKGEIYHLYQRNDQKLFLSIIARERIFIFEAKGSKNKVCHAAVVLPASSAVPHHHDA